MQATLTLSSIGAGGKVGCVLFSSDGSLLAAATAERILLYDVPTGALRSTLPHIVHPMPASTLQPCQLSFSPCGLLVVSSLSSQI